MALVKLVMVRHFGNYSEGSTNESCAAHTIVSNIDVSVLFLVCSVGYVIMDINGNLYLE